MVPHTTAHEDTFVNAVSKQSTLSQVRQLPQCLQPTPPAPATLAAQMSQAMAVPAMPAVSKNALAPMSVTSHATPLQPHRSGHAHMAPRCLIQEI